MNETILLTSTKIKEVDCPIFMNEQLVQKWMQTIPSFSENDPALPEWKATPVKQLDLTKQGYGMVSVKDESDKSSNPTGTIKDRAAWELATLYRDYARALYLRMKSGELSISELSKTPVPRLSLITSGNEGVAVAERFKIHSLPAPKLLMSSNTSSPIIEELKKLDAELFLTDLEKKLSADDIKKLTGNENGIDITSLRYASPERVFYDWHVHEAFNENPDEIYIPFGSGRLMSNFLFWQARSLHGSKPDPRLSIDVAKLVNIHILGAEPIKHPSVADKLSASHKPFTIFDQNDVQAAISFASTGRSGGKYNIEEERILQAHQILNDHGISAEHSGAAGLALYLARFDEKLVKPENKVLIINTGKGAHSK